MEFSAEAQWSNLCLGCMSTLIYSYFSPFSQESINKKNMLRIGYKMGGTSFLHHLLRA